MNMQPQHSFFYQQLDSKRRKNYDSILNALEKRKHKMNINDANEAELFEHVLRDHPEIFYVSNFFENIISPLGKSMHFRYIYSENEIRKYEQMIFKVVEDFLSNYIKTGQSVYEKIVCAHDFLVAEVAYDQEAGMSNDSNRYRDSYNVIGALLKKRCVCEGYAAAMKMICDVLNIPCEVIVGTADNEIESGNHAWNIVQINGEYQHVDVTWDAQFTLMSEVSFPNYFYLNVDDHTMQNDHFWNRTAYPRCPVASYNYFKINNLIVTDKRMLLNLLRDALEFQEEKIYFLMSYDIGNGDTEPNYVAKVFNEAANQCKFVSVNGYRYYFLERYHIYLFQPDYK